MKYTQLISIKQIITYTFIAPYVMIPGSNVSKRINFILYHLSYTYHKPWFGELFQ